MSDGFTYLDLEALLAQREAQHEAAGIGGMTSANAGPYTMPFGPMLTRQIPVGSPDPASIPSCDGAYECPFTHPFWDALTGRR